MSILRVKYYLGYEFNEDVIKMKLNNTTPITMTTVVDIIDHSKRGFNTVLREMMCILLNYVYFPPFLLMNSPP